MTDDTKRGRRPKFEEAATLISEPSPLWDKPGRGAPAGPAAGAPPRPPAAPQAPYGSSTIDLSEEDAEFVDTPIHGTQLPDRHGVIDPRTPYPPHGGYAPQGYPPQGYSPDYAPAAPGYGAAGEAPLQLQAPSPFQHRAAGGVSPDRSVALVHAPDSAAAAQWRLLKFKLKENGDPRVLAVTSAGQGEGKSVAAANLSLCLAEGQRARVVLLEANLRTPSLSSLFGLEVPVGLTDQLRRRRRDPDAGWELYELASNFFFLPCGRPAENPAAMLASEQFTALVRDLRLYYDFVVVDTPGALIAADMNIVQDLVEGVVVVCRGGVSTRPQLKKALSRLAQHNLVGLVLVDAP
jgi:Mrp family chromosome partitioning ATPase